MKLPKLSIPLIPVLAMTAALCLPAASGAAAPTGKLTLSASGAAKASPRAKRSYTARAINVNTGAVTAKTAKKSSIALNLAPGPYVVALRVTDSDGRTSEGVGKLLAVKASRKTKQRVKVKRLKAKKRRKSARAAASTDGIYAPDAETAGRLIVGIDPNVVISGVKGYPNGVPIDGMLATPLSQACPAGGPEVTLVEIRHRGEIIEELQRANDPRFDKSTTVKPGKLLRERQMVRGGGTVKNGRATIKLTVVDLETGAVIATSEVDGRLRDLFGVIDEAGSELLKDLCGERVDISFSGTGTYARDEGNASTDSQDAVRANYSWTIDYKGVKLAADGTINMATSASGTGTWSTDGRYGAEGPGNYHCGGPVVNHNGEFAMMTQKKVGGKRQFTINPFLNMQTDVFAIACTGLPGPPFASFALWGNNPANQAVVEFSSVELEAGPKTFNVSPQTVLAPDCSDVIGSIESPCTQTGNWSGQVTISRAAGS